MLQSITDQKFFTGMFGGKCSLLGLAAIQWIFFGIDKGGHVLRPFADNAAVHGRRDARCVEEEARIGMQQARAVSV